MGIGRVKIKGEQCRYIHVQLKVYAVFVLVVVEVAGIFMLYAIALIYGIALVVVMIMVVFMFVFVFVFMRVLGMVIVRDCFAEWVKFVWHSGRLDGPQCQGVVHDQQQGKNNLCVHGSHSEQLVLGA